MLIGVAIGMRGMSFGIIASSASICSLGMYELENTSVSRAAS